MPPSRLTPDLFVGLIRQSKLVDEGILKSALREMLSLPGVTKDPHKIAEELVQRKLLTRWQADKLLQGRHKGFFLGKYKLLSHLGRGGAGTVYLAEHSLMERQVAIKVLPRSNADEGTLLARFRREAQALAALDHPNIVRANDIDQDGQIHFLVMEYVAGRSLQELVDADGPVSPVAAAEYMRQAAEGLHQAHKAGMVHRDIKPANLLLSDRGQVKLLDLGLARMYEPGDNNLVTRQEQQLGTVDYMSPEQIKDPRQVDARSDLYSLGCTLYFLLVGQPPFNEGNDVNRLMAHQNTPPIPPSHKRSGIPSELEGICLKLMSKSPADRCQSARELTRELVAFLNQSGGAEWAAMNPVLGSSSLVGNRPSGAGSAVGPAGGTSAGVSSGGGKSTPSVAPGSHAGPPPAAATSVTTASRTAVAGPSSGSSPARPAASTGIARGADSSDGSIEQSGRKTGVYAPVEDINVSVDLSHLNPTGNDHDSRLQSFLNHLESPGAFPTGNAFADPNLMDGEFPEDGREPAPTVIVPEGWTPDQGGPGARGELSDRGFREGAEAELFEATGPLEREPSLPVRSPPAGAAAFPGRIVPGVPSEAPRPVPAVATDPAAARPIPARPMPTGETWAPADEAPLSTTRPDARRSSQRAGSPLWKRPPGWLVGAALGLLALLLIVWWLSRSPAR